MNVRYHSLWNSALSAWVAVSEIARSCGQRGKGGRRARGTSARMTLALASGLALLGAGDAFAQDQSYASGDNKATPLVSSTSITLTNSDSGSATQSGSISGAGSVVKQGPGTLALSGTNSYGGGTFVNAGVLRVSKDANLGATTGNLTLDGGTLQYAAGFSTSRSILLGSGGGTVDVNGLTGFLNGSISGNGGLTVVDSPTGLGGGLYLTQANSYSGGTLLNGYNRTGTVTTITQLTAAATGALGSGPVLVQGGILNFFGASAQNLQITNRSTNGQRASLNFKQGADAGTANITNTGTGDRVTFYDTANAASATITQGAGAVLDISPATTGTSIGSLSGAGDVNLGAKVLTLGALGRDDMLSGVVGDSLTFNGTGPGSLVKVGNGTLTLSGANTYKGGTTLRAGQLNLGNSTALGTGALAINDGTTLGFSADGLNIANAVQLTGGNAVVDTRGSRDTSLLGQIGGAGALSLINSSTRSGNLIVSGINTYSGGTTIGGAGTPLSVAVSASNPQALGTGPVTMAPNGQLDLQGSGTFANTLSVAATGFVNIGPQITLGSQNVTIAAADANHNVGGSLQVFGGLGSASVSNSGYMRFVGSPLPGGATLAPVADRATVVNNATGVVDVSGAGAGFMTIGSLSGSGVLLLGATPLTLGSLGRNDTLGGAIADWLPGVGIGNGGSGGSLLKIGNGTLTLTGANTYTGGTTVFGGTLAVGNSGALGTGALTLADGTTLGFADNGLNIANNILLPGQFDPTIDTGSYNATLSGAISGVGALTKTGSGTLILTGANTYSGATAVAAGTLQAGAANSFSPASAFGVASGAILDAAGHNQSVASLANSGTVSLVGATPGTTLTVNGAYVGNAGVLRLGTFLGGGGSASDQLVLNGPGASASGTTTLQISNLGGLGALTAGNGIQVVSALNGATTTAQTTKSAFTLSGGHVDAGAYAYGLYAADANGAGDNWYLRSATTVTVPVIPPATPGAPGAPGAPAPVPATVTLQVPTYRAEASLYAALPNQLRQSNLAMLGNMRLRVGDDEVKGTGTMPGDSGRRAWGRVLSADIDIRQGGTVSPSSRGRVTGLQAGTDLLSTPNWRAGVYVGQLDGDATVNGFASGIGNLRTGRNNLRSQYLGVYGTYTNDGGFYADAVVQSGRHRYTVQPMLSAGVEGKGNSLLASIEVGQAFALGSSGWSVEPQLQLIHQHLNLGNSTIAGAVIQPDADSGWIARAGIRVKGEIATSVGTLQPYGRLNVYKSSSGMDVARFINPAAITDIAAPIGGTSTELAGGFTLALSQTTSLYGEVGKLWASGGNARIASSINGSLGVRMKW